MMMIHVFEDDWRHQGTTYRNALGLGPGFFLAHMSFVHTYMHMHIHSICKMYIHTHIHVNVQIVHAYICMHVFSDYEV